MAGRGRVVEAEERSLSQEVCKKVLSRKKAPPNPILLRISHLMMNHLIMMKNWTDLLLQLLLGPHRLHTTSRPSSPVSSIAGDDKGPGQGPA